MAITFVKTLAKVAPVYNENYLRLKDSNAGLTNYKYIVKLYQKQLTASAYSLVGRFTYFPLADGALEFEPMTILSNYINNGNYDYDVDAFEYRSSIFQYKIEVYRTYEGATEQIITTLDPYYAFDGAISQAEMDQLSTIVLNLTPAILYATKTPTAVIEQRERNTTFSFAGSAADFPGTLVYAMGFGTGWNGWHTVMANGQHSPGVYYVQIDIPEGYPTTGSFVFYGYETTVNRSLSNCPTSLSLSEFDYYTADFLKYMPYADYVASTYRGIRLTLYNSNGVDTFYSNELPSSANNIENYVLSLGIGPKNIKEALWLGDDGLISGTDIFATYDFTTYSICLTSLHTQLGVSDVVPIIRPITVNVCRTNTPINKKGYDRTWLVYKSKLGGWSYLPYNMKAKKYQDVAQTTFNRRLKYNETYKSRGTTVISNSVSQTYTLTSDFITTDWKFHEDLFASPQIYMLRTYVNGEANLVDPFLPCVIKSSGTQIYKPNDDGVFHYTIDIETAVQTIRQRT